MLRRIFQRAPAVTDPCLKKCIEAKHKADAQRYEERVRMEKNGIEIYKKQTTAFAVFKKNLRHATRKEYTEWLHGWVDLHRGKACPTFADHPFYPEFNYVPLESCTIPIEMSNWGKDWPCTQVPIHIIVPKGITLDLPQGFKFGMYYPEILMMDGYTSNRGGATMFTDTVW